MTSSHRSALWFLRGGLVAVVALLVPSQVGVVSRDVPALQPLVSFLRIAVPALGFAAGGAIGGSSLGVGRRGMFASGAAFLVTGVGLTLLAPSLTGLTGFEDPLTVLAFAGAGTAAAFASGGAVLALLLARRQVVPLSAGFLAGGAVGGVISVLPAVLAAALGAWPADLQLFMRLACSLVGLLGPFAVAGGVAGSVFEGREEDRT